MKLALWIEEELGAELDPASFDMQEEWATPRALLEFVTRNQAVQTADT